MRSRVKVVNLVLLSPIVLLLLLLLAMGCATTSTATTNTDNSKVPKDLFEDTLVQLMHQRRMFIDSFANGTAAIDRSSSDFQDRAPAANATARTTAVSAEANEGRGKKKKLLQMNRTLIAVIMAYSLKFMFLIPSFVGTLILLKFTTVLAGFFYALFAAVLGLDHHQHH